MKSSEPPYTGGCNCGAIRFTVHRRPMSAGYCHCKRCQRRAGVASTVSAIVSAADVTFDDETHLRTWQPDDGTAKVFCAMCGSQIMSSRDDVRAIRFGAFDGDPGIRPSFHQWVESAPDWEVIPDDGLPRFLRAKPR